MSLDAATLALVAGELKNTLLDAKIDKIFEPTRDDGAHDPCAPAPRPTVCCCRPAAARPASA